MPKIGGRWFVRDLGFALGSFALGLLVRWPLQPVMRTKLIWLTFYPFIMVSALLGGATVKIVAVTASVFREELDSHRAIGFDEVLTKPFPPEKVAELMGSLLGLSFAGVPVTEGTSLATGAEAIDSCVFQLQKQEPGLAAAIRLSIEELDHAGLRAGLLETAKGEAS